MSTHNICILGRTRENYPLIIVKYPAYLFHCCLSEYLGWLWYTTIDLHMQMITAGIQARTQGGAILAEQIISKPCSFSPEFEFAVLILA